MHADAPPLRLGVNEAHASAITALKYCGSDPVLTSSLGDVASAAMPMGEAASPGGLKLANGQDCCIPAQARTCPAPAPCARIGLGNEFVAAASRKCRIFRGFPRRREEPN